MCLRALAASVSALRSFGRGTTYHFLILWSWERSYICSLFKDLFSYLSLKQPRNDVLFSLGFLLLFFIFRHILFCLFEYFAYMCVCASCECLVPKELQRCPGNWSPDGCKSARGRWKLNPGPQQQQPVLWAAGPSLQSTLLFHFAFLFCYGFYSFFENRSFCTIYSDHSFPFPSSSQGFPHLPSFWVYNNSVSRYKTNSI